MGFMLTYQYVRSTTPTQPWLFMTLASMSWTNFQLAKTTEQVTLNITISITDYNPTATERLDVDLIITNLEGTIRLPTAEEENAMCTICLENYPVNRICSLVCGHTFHFPCIDQWIHGTISCPICMESNLWFDLPYHFQITICCVLMRSSNLGYQVL